MSTSIDVKVPDIGNYTGVPVIEVLVKVGDVVAKDQRLVTLESDKATKASSSLARTLKQRLGAIDETNAEGDVVVEILTALEESTGSVLHNRMSRRRTVERVPPASAVVPLPGNDRNRMGGARLSCSIACRRHVPADRQHVSR